MNVVRVSGIDNVDPIALEAATRAALAAGGVLLYPTDTLYALGCRAADPTAAARVRRSKGRDEAKPLPLVAAGLSQVEPLVGAWSEAARRLAERFWPGPLTLVLPLGAELPIEVTAGADTVAVRVPASLFVRRLCEAAGPLVSTSANRSGQPASGSFAEAMAAVGSLADVSIDAGPLEGPASTIVETTGQPRLLRPGRLPWEVILGALTS